MRTKKINQIQSGKIKFNDLNKPSNPLFSNKFMIAGKPDYIIKQKDNFIPVEYKTSLYKNPQKNHVFQLAAYCQLVEENFNCFVPYGILVYNQDCSFKIDFNPALRFDLEKTLFDMRRMIVKNEVIRSHNDVGRCKNCSMNYCCNEKII